RLLEIAEKRVARAEGDRDAAALDESHSDKAARVVPGPAHDLDIAWISVPLDPIRRERADDRPRFANLRQSLPKPGRRRLERFRRPCLARQVHEVHAGAVARIDRSILPREEARHERAHEVDSARRFVEIAALLPELADLWSREPLEGPRTGDAREL